MLEPPAQTLSFPPLIVSAAMAIRRLRCVRFTSASDAVEQLAVWQETSRILQLFRRYFPQEFARSSASTVIPKQGDERGYSERELEFFRLVDQRLFPLPEMMFDMERLPSIPIYPQGVDWEDDSENLPLSLRAAMALISDGDGCSWESWLPKHIRPEAGERDWSRFMRLCRKAKGRATRFPLLIQLAAHDTGNMWLDTSREYSWEEYFWGEQEMEFLIREWRKAERIFAQLNPLLDQMDKHPRYWLRRLVKLWNAAVKVPPEQSPNPV